MDLGTIDAALGSKSKKNNYLYQDYQEALTKLHSKVEESEITLKQAFELFCQDVHTSKLTDLKEPHYEETKPCITSDQLKHVLELFKCNFTDTEIDILVQFATKDDYIDFDEFDAAIIHAREGFHYNKAKSGKMLQGLSQELCLRIFQNRYHI